MDETEELQDRCNNIAVEAVFDAQKEREVNHSAL